MFTCSLLQIISLCADARMKTRAIQWRDTKQLKIFLLFSPRRLRVFVSIFGAFLHSTLSRSSLIEASPAVMSLSFDNFHPQLKSQAIEVLTKELDNCQRTFSLHSRDFQIIAAFSELAQSLAVRSDFRPIRERLRVTKFSTFQDFSDWKSYLEKDKTKYKWKHIFVD